MVAEGKTIQNVKFRFFILLYFLRIFCIFGLVCLRRAIFIAAIFNELFCSDIPFQCRFLNCIAIILYCAVMFLLFYCIVIIYQ